MTASATYVNVTAGSAAATTDGDVSGFLAIDFGTGCTAGGCSNTIFSGSVFSLYLSPNGFSSTTGDLLYAGGPTDKSSFTVTSLATGWTEVPELNGTFHIGAVGGHGVLEGPIPAKISSNYKYIKIYDGTSTSVAVSAQQIHFLPGLSLSPTSGAAGTSVAVSGGGFPASTTIDINYSYTYQEWNSAPVLMHGQWITGVSTGPGFFTTTATMLDTKQPVNPISNATLITSVNITFRAVTHTYPHTVFGVLPVIFTESSRVFVQEFSYMPDGTASGSNTAGPFGNDTGTAPVFTVLSGYVTGSIGIQGNFSALGSTVEVTLGSHSVSVTANAISGMWIANITVPVLAGGTQTVYVTNNGVTYQFNILIVPTLVLTPSSGPVGTHVIVTAYGFAPTGHKAPVVLYWFEYVLGTGTNFWLVNATVGADGAFNNTSPVTFTVAPAYGGGHNVTASTVCLTGGCKAGNSTGNIPVLDIESFAVFTIKPTLVVCSSSNICGAGDVNNDTISVNANSRDLLSLVGSGFTPGWQFINLNSASYSDCNTFAASTGNFYMNFTAAGFRPGLQQFETWACNESAKDMTGAPGAWAFFNVTTIGDYTTTGGGSLPSSVNDTINNINTHVNTILGWGETIDSINTNVNTINAAISTIGTNLNTTLGWGTTINNINTNLNTISTTIGTINTNVNTILSDLTTLTTAVNTAASNALAAKTAATDTHDSVSSTETYVLVVAVLAAITLVLELAILVRKLD